MTTDVEPSVLADLGARSEPDGERPVSRRARGTAARLGAIREVHL